MSIDEEALRAAFASLTARVTAIELASGLFVEDKVLDSPRANIKINFDPRDWRGPSCKGKQAADCPPEFLEMYASALQYFADHPKEGDKPDKPRWNRLDAARCRSWARRIRRIRNAPETQFQAKPAPVADAQYAEVDEDLFDDDSQSSADDGDIFT